MMPRVAVPGAIFLQRSREGEVSVVLVGQTRTTTELGGWLRVEEIFLSGKKPWYYFLLVVLFFGRYEVKRGY
jgi:hypothetical protein